MRCRRCHGMQRRASRLHPSGYVRLFMPEHVLANADGYVLEHRLVLYNAGIVVPEGWHTHHLDGDKTNNAVDNLAVMRASAHHRLHIQAAGAVTNQHGTFPVLHDPDERRERVRLRNVAKREYKAEWGRRRKTADRNTA